MCYNGRVQREFMIHIRETLHDIHWGKLLRYLAIVIAGNLIAAAASALFILPNDLIMGGTTGIGIFVEHFLSGENSSMIVSGIVLIANIILYLIGVLLLGKKFAFATLLGTFLYPSFMGMYSAILGDRRLTENPVLAMICGGVLMGVGIGLVVREGASTGGTDIPPLIFHKFFGLPVSVGMWLVDLTVVLLQAFIMPVETTLYGIVIVVFYSVVIDKVSPIGLKKMQVKIVSRKYKEIREMILNKLNRGVTQLFGQTGFLKERCNVLLTIVSNRELVRLKDEVQKIDPEAFLTVSVVTEVRGRGFSRDKIALPKSEERFDAEDLAEVASETAAPQEASPSEAK